MLKSAQLWTFESRWLYKIEFEVDTRDPPLQIANLVGSREVERGESENESNGDVKWPLDLRPTIVLVKNNLT